MVEITHTTLKITLVVIIILLGFVGYIIAVSETSRAYDRAQQACQAYAREHVPDVDPVAWCEP